MISQALVTGANGFIGSHLVEALIGAGIRVRALVRRTSDLRWIENLPVERCFGDLRSGEGLSDALRGADVCFHLAGKTKAVNRSEFEQANVIGTRNLIQAAQEQAGFLNRFVFVSTLAVAGPSKEGRPVRETDGPDPLTEYGRSKCKAESIVMDVRDTLPVTVVRPPGVYGPRDTDFLEVFRAVSLGIRPKLGFQERHTSLIYVEDLVRGLILTAEHPASVGEIFYLVSEPDVTWSELTRRIGEIMARPGMQIPIPLSIFALIALGQEIVTRLTGRPSILNWDKIKEYRQTAWVCDGGKAERSLGFKKSVSFDEALRRTIRWYRHQGWLSVPRNSRSMDS